MAITYKPMSGFPEVNLPVLHRIEYSRLYEGVQFQYQKSYRDLMINEWLKTNCKHRYYHAPSYLREKFIEFECDEDAAFFALRWL